MFLVSLMWLHFLRFSFQWVTYQQSPEKRKEKNFEDFFNDNTVEKKSNIH